MSSSFYPLKGNHLKMPLLGILRYNREDSRGFSNISSRNINESLLYLKIY
nr:MAG TPA: hypothetical protein [Caudoviricetes sp.]